jgi:hypothetical protein
MYGQTLVKIFNTKYHEILVSCSEFLHVENGRAGKTFRHGKVNMRVKKKSFPCDSADKNKTGRLNPKRKDAFKLFVFCFRHWRRLHPLS